MRVSPLSASYQPVQLVLVQSEQAAVEFRPGDRIEGQVLQMVDNVAQVQIGDSVINIRSSVPLLPGQVVFLVEDHLQGEWRLRVLSNEPSLYLLREQISEMRLQPDASREILLKAFLGEFNLDRELFLQAEQLWKTVERNADFLTALVLLFKSGEELNESNLRGMYASMQQSDAPGWLQNQATDIARNLILGWNLPLTNEREQLLTALLLNAPSAGDLDFTMERWLDQIAAIHNPQFSGAPLREASLVSGEGEVLTTIDPELAGDTQATAAGRTRGSALRPSGEETVPTVLRQSSAGESSQTTRTTLGNALSGVERSRSELTLAKNLFQQAELLWRDTGYNRELLPQLARLFYSGSSIQGRNLLQLIHEQESRVQFAALDLSEVEMGDKRLLLRQMNLSESQERFVLLQRLHRDYDQHLTREDFLQAERAWRSLGGRERDLDLVARLSTQRLPMEVSSAWALQLMEEHRWQNALAYLWLQQSDPPVLEGHVIDPDERQQQSRGDAQPLVLIGFISERLGPVLLSVTARDTERYFLQLSVDPVWQREVRQELLRELQPRLREIMPALRLQVSAMTRENEPGANHRSTVKPSRRFDIRI